LNTVKVKKLYEDTIMPTKGSKYSACWDLYAHLRYKYASTISILPHQTVKIGTGVSFQPPNGYFGAIFARSGLATKEGLRPANCVGVADEDYTGEYIVALHNDTNEVQCVKNGDRIAQVAFIPYYSGVLEKAVHFLDTDRGENGFGSTGK
jgi:dUTP pyrophosphatase